MTTPINDSEFEATMASPAYVQNVVPLDDETRFAELDKTPDERTASIADVARRFAAADHANIEGFVLIVLPKYNDKGETRLKVEVGGSSQAKAEMLKGLIDAMALQVGAQQARAALRKGARK